MSTVSNAANEERKSPLRPGQPIKVSVENGATCEIYRGLTLGVGQKPANNLPRGSPVSEVNALTGEMLAA